MACFTLFTQPLLSGSGFLLPDASIGARLYVLTIPNKTLPKARYAVVRPLSYEI
jgi:hypothetical protein